MALHSRLFLTALLLTIEMEAVSRQIYHCAKVKSKNCVIANISADSSDSVTLSDLGDKTLLHIKEGQLLHFSKKLADQLGNVVKLELGPLGMRELFLRPQLIAVEANGNQIAAISFDSQAEYSTEILKLNGNRLSTLAGFEVLIHLKELWLSSNDLDRIDMNVFENMESLERLTLDRNQIVTIEAASPIVLPHLSNLSLSDNRINKLDVSNWDFESLTELNLSGNDLIHIESFHERFVTLQYVSLARNSWYCSWLETILQKFSKTYVTVKDRDQGCEGSSRANLCCLAELDSGTYDENFEKLEKLQKNHAALQKKLHAQIQTIEADQNKMLKNIDVRFSKLEKQKTSGGLITTVSTESVVASQAARKKVLEIKNSWSSVIKKFENQREANRKVQQRLGLAIVELKRTLERDTKAIAELQAQFGQLKDHVRNVLEKRDIMNG
ncbi:protein flightless-1 homolog [Toxorhynchites rutilus septentrionalis]|uniref:protein flightless-1 homolog n=1 Tax=Toxorhynchites rutilus septentrionalis TaxID=329112 RepID=UPI00247896C7|nr:protein flightless-1 homolog [Toxorhynchites rutilus septentrionalis]